MSQFPRTISAKFLNQLAQSEEAYHNQLQAKRYQESNKIKMKCLNQLARTDESFQPSLTPQKSLKSTLTSPYTLSKELSLSFNPEQIEAIQEAQSAKIVRFDSDIVEDDLEKSIIVKIDNEYTQRYEDQVYCFQCDQTSVEASHKCKYQFSNISAINKRLLQLLTLMKVSKSDKFSILTDGAYAANSSQQIITIINLLKASSIHHTNFELFLRKRLINLSSKKLGLVLQQEDDE